MKKILFLSLALVTLMACTKNENPLLVEQNTPFGVPAFDKVKIEHYLPAFEKAIAENEAEIAAIEAEIAALQAQYAELQTRYDAAGTLEKIKIGAEMAKVLAQIEAKELVDGAVAEFGDYIGSQTLAVSVKCSVEPQGEFVVESDIDEEPLRIAITKMH